MENIPKKIHYCWFGRGPKPNNVLKYIEGWKKIHADYKIIEWNEDNFDLNQYDYVKEAYEAKRYAFVTDVVRLYALYTEGGIYMDTDVELIKPLDDFLDNEAFTGCERKDMCVTGLMASKPRGTWIKALLDNYNGRSFIIDGKVDLTTNTSVITDITKNEFGWKEMNTTQHLKEVTIYASDFFCAKSYKTGKVHLTENTHAIHHFNASWKTPQEKIKSKILDTLKFIIITIFGEKLFNKINKATRK